MVRLNPRRRAAFGQALLELANFAAAALIFGQFVGQQAVSWTLVAAGITFWSILISYGLWLVGRQ
jgi:hypothetical protein